MQMNRQGDSQTESRATLSKQAPHASEVFGVRLAPLLRQDKQEEACSVLCLGCLLVTQRVHFEKFIKMYT